MPDAHARPTARRFELDHQPRIAHLGGEFGGAPRLHDAFSRVEPEKDSVDVAIPGNEAPARPRLDDRLAAAGEGRMLARVQPGPVDAHRVRADHGLDLEEVGHLPRCYRIGMPDIHFLDRRTAECALPWGMPTGLQTNAPRALSAFE